MKSASRMGAQRDWRARNTKRSVEPVEHIERSVKTNGNESIHQPARTKEVTVYLLRHRTQVVTGERLSESFAALSSQGEMREGQGRPRKDLLGVK